MSTVISANDKVAQWPRLGFSEVFMILSQHFVRVEANKCRAGHFLFCLMSYIVLCWWELACSRSETFSFKASTQSCSQNINIRFRRTLTLLLLRRIYLEFLWKWSFIISSIFRRIFRKLNCCIRSIKVHKMYSTPLRMLCSSARNKSNQKINQDSQDTAQSLLWHFILPTRISQTMAVFLWCKLNITECRVHNVTRRIGSIIQQMKSWRNALLALDFYSGANHIWHQQPQRWSTN